MTIDVSVCIPTYNSFEKFLQCIESVFEQDFENFEILVGDDSTDQVVAEKISNYCKQKSIFYFHNTPNQGPAANWNLLIKRSSGRLIKFLHHDDILSRTDSLRQFASAIDCDRNLSILFSSSNLVDITGLIGVTTVDKYTCSKINSSPSLLFSKNLLGSPSACIFRKFDNLLFDNKYRWLVDLEFYYRSMQHGKIGCIEDTLVDVGVHKVGRLTSTVQHDRELNIREHLDFARSLRPTHLHLRVLVRLLRIYIKFSFLTTWRGTKGQNCDG